MARVPIMIASIRETVVSIQGVDMKELQRMMPMNFIVLDILQIQLGSQPLKFQRLYLQMQ